MKNASALEKDLFGFPDDLSYDDFLGLPERVRDEIVERNRVLQTDTYNRTMAHAKGEDWRVPERYVLQLRKAPRGYLIANGVRRKLEELFSLPISENEVRFAADFYRTRAWVPHFNEKMWREVVDDHGGRPPLTVHSVPDGTAILPGDPLLRVEGPGELAAHYEPDFHRVFYRSLTATDAHLIAEKIGIERFVEFGKRGSATEGLHVMALRAMLEGSRMRRTSNDAAVAAEPDHFGDSGTTGHRFLQFYDTEEASMRRAIESMSATALLVDLTNSRRGIDTVVKLKKEYRHTGKKIWIRLDSGDLTALAIYALRAFQEAGFTDRGLDKIVIEDLSKIDDMVAIDDAVSDAGFDARAYLVYGAGSLLTTKDKSRGDASSGFKLSARMQGDVWMPKAKIPEEHGKESLPGEPTLFYVPGEGRMVGQVGEYPAAHDRSVLAYDGNDIVLPGGVENAWKQLDRTMPEIRSLIGRRSPLSPQTQAQLRDLRAHYGIS